MLLFVEKIDTISKTNDVLDFNNLTKSEWQYVHTDLDMTTNILYTPAVRGFDTDTLDYHHGMFVCTLEISKIPYETYETLIEG